MASNIIDNQYIFCSERTLENQAWFCDFELQTLQETKQQKINLTKKEREQIEYEIRFMQEEISLIKQAKRIRQEHKEKQK